MVAAGCRGKGKKEGKVKNRGKEKERGRRKVITSSEILYQYKSLY